jgi:hypothetical protein
MGRQRVIVLDAALMHECWLKDESKAKIILTNRGSCETQLGALSIRAAARQNSKCRAHSRHPVDGRIDDASSVNCII